MWFRRNKTVGHVDMWCQFEYSQGLIRSGCPACQANYERDKMKGTVPVYKKPKKNMPWTILNETYLFKPWYTH